MRLPGVEIALKKSEQVPCCFGRGGFIVHDNIYNAVRRLNVCRADFRRFKSAETTTFDHGRTGHANPRGARGDRDIGARGSRRIPKRSRPPHDMARLSEPGAQSSDLLSYGFDDHHSVDCL